MKLKYARFMKKRLLIIGGVILLIIGLVWYFVPAVRQLTATVQDQATASVQSGLETVEFATQPLTETFATVSQTIKPVTDFSSETIYPMIAGVATQSGVLEINEIRIDPAEISSSLNDLPNQPAKQALYMYCQQIVQEYENQSMVE